MFSKNTKWILIITAAIIFLFKIIISIKSLPPATINEAQGAYFSFSAFKVESDQADSFWRFGKEQGYLLFWVPIVLLKILFLFSPVSLVSIRSLSLILTLVSSFLFASIGVNLLKGDKKHRLSLFLIAFLVFYLSPWLNFLSTFQLPETLTLFFILFSAYSYLNKDKNNFFQLAYPASFTLAAFTSWPGLIITSSFLLILALFNIKQIRTQHKYAKLSLVFALLLLTFLYTNRAFVIKTFEKSFAYRFLPEKLAFEINERQKIDFLAVNRKFVLPSLFRKFTYNKPSLAISKILSQAISFIDFEQFASPFDSYEIIRLSGLAPKGNPELGYIWELPLIAYGVYIFVQRKRVLHKKRVSLFLLSAFIPYLAFEKKFMSQTAFILIPAFLLFETLAIHTLITKISHIKPVSIKSLIFASATLVALLGIISYHHSFFSKSKNSQTVHPYLFREIARWLIEYKNENDKIILTTRFGPTHLMSAFYLKTDPIIFWSEFLSNKEKKQFENITFKPFQVGEETLEADTIYIGLIGEFVGKGRGLEERNIPTSFKLIKKISAEDETVFEYGKEIWIGYFE